MSRVSVVIPTFNAGPEFEELLEKISMQEGDFEREAIVVDSGSTDGTVELARRYGARVHQIRKEEFNHGATRNLGISLSRGEYVALTVQDAIPLDERWLAAMVENLEHDERVAGVYSRQLPREDADVLTRAVVNARRTASLERREQPGESPKRYRRMHPRKRRRLATFDDVSSCIRRSVWEKIPYERTSFGEDLRWSKRVIEAGYKIVYEPRSAVIHSHERGAMYDLRRHYVDQRLSLELFGLRLVPNVLRLLVAIPRSSLENYRLLRKESSEGKLRLMLVAIEHAVAPQVGFYLAGKGPAISRLSPRAFGKLDRFLSRGV
ncbi:MAG: glycosyltransferase family 2 protein [Actinomycetota bacterium]|nr:glycosyltransferase family 2 protein [Actinomycetota bacterium]